MKLESIRNGWLALVVVASLLTGPAILADDGQKGETLNNAAIIELQGLNLGDNVIIDKIKSSKCDFDVTVAGLKQLKEAKVSDEVIRAMLAAGTPPAQPAASAGAAAAPEAGTAAPASPPAGDVNDPATMHDSGVWLCEEDGGTKKMTPLVGEPFRLWMGAGPFGGAQRAVLTGLASKTTTAASRPVFYMYFGEAAKNDWGIMATTTPDQLPLAKLDLKPKTEERLLVVGSVAPFAGYNSGIPKKSLETFDSEKVAPGIYKVTVSKDLPDGEYAFCLYRSEVQVGVAGRMFTFGVHSK